MTGRRKNRTVAGALSALTVLVLGSGSWWLFAQVRTIEEAQQEAVQHLPLFSCRGRQDNLPRPRTARRPSPEEGRTAILEELRAELGYRPTLLSWQPWTPYGKRGGVVKVTYRCVVSGTPAQATFLVANLADDFQALPIPESLLDNMQQSSARLPADSSCP
jgi:hypothetical protein